ncbi:hypothetical protein GOHSU_17_00150 [Gordonia hirsuta DSM 44140 = NBRC 16056]|uniref:Uncharacterized protein n=1 Tax=Gordonia hirsuta DSM 44140 = NBRC 16056 TaxID=1121927 RepID=L7LAX1_9ACTN|nr:hypothetical protein [Gordonia hirsuta]GAC57212.1 hypothetical protein GOHSU_17_00150 [Gordonia hirsuta DSM 44140 = NBRC 16056]
MTKGQEELFLWKRTVPGSPLERLLGGPETVWLIDRVRVRLVDCDGGPLCGVVVLSTPDRLAVRSDRPPDWPGGASKTLRVDLSAVEDVLRRGLWPAARAEWRRGIATWRRRRVVLALPSRKKRWSRSW